MKPGYAAGPAIMEKDRLMFGKGGFPRIPGVFWGYHALE
jgi:hypothetical protein